MTRINRSALVPYPARSMYEVVNNVADYPRFLPWCADAKILSQSEDSIEASLLIKKAGVHQWFTTRNSLVKYETIAMQLVDGPFKRLDGCWNFSDIADQGCKVSLSLEFEFSHGFGQSLIAPVFSQIANTMVDSFCARADEVYGV